MNLETSQGQQHAQCHCSCDAGHCSWASSVSRRCKICFCECERSSSSSAQPASSSLSSSSSVRGANPRDLGPELLIIDTSKTGTSTGSPQTCVTGSPLISFFFFVTTFRHFATNHFKKEYSVANSIFLKKKSPQFPTIMRGFFNIARIRPNFYSQFTRKLAKYIYIERCLILFYFWYFSFIANFD
jgi:hypothetical protein